MPRLHEPVKSRAVNIIYGFFELVYLGTFATCPNNKVKSYHLEHVLVLFILSKMYVYCKCRYI